ncbi:two-component system sensor histidine kinase CreC [Pseudoxanthomonas sp. JBR18]|uniref:two-component system sensor histidine kinase CreC n=1 Tax=Pseudoxanthomonas sp. JBR18 TaxID=2969308 RepID=UPI0023055B7F|nr:two-component system sensor histidine kinase CreC [Pseudoxanthomonas sp. JBR18]WCE04082.1 two-component system sensor histidine kinase CreC [Pseudoxanthomonas sp. JBR18]
MRIGLRLFLGFFLITGLAAFFVMRVFVNEVKPGVRQAMESTLVDTANVLAVMAADDLAAGRIDDGRFARDMDAAFQREVDAHIWQIPKKRVDYRVSITDAHGVVVYDSRGKNLGRDNSRWNDVYLTLRGEYGARSSPESPGDTAHTVMHVAAPIYAPGSQPPRLIGVLTLSQPNRTFEPFIAASQRSILRRGGWLIGLSVLIGVLMTWWLSRGIGRLNRYAQAVSAGQPVAPPKPRRDEIGDLGQALETMRRKLEGKDYVEQYVQSLTHEMKSPLAGIRGAAELLQEPIPEADRQRFARNILDQQQRLTETIEKLLALAEVEQHGWLQTRTRIEVARLLDEVRAAAAPRMQAAGVALQVRCAPGLAVQGDAFLLRQALLNLLDNARAFSAPGSEVALIAEASGGQVSIIVRDTGPGVPDYALERVFERFYSLASPATGQRGTGLGLPFVREVARLHGGQVQLANAAESGAEACVQLPTA